MKQSACCKDCVPGCIVVLPLLEIINYSLITRMIVCCSVAWLIDGDAVVQEVTARPAAGGGGCVCGVERGEIRRGLQEGGMGGNNQWLL